MHDSSLSNREAEAGGSGVSGLGYCNKILFFFFFQKREKEGMNINPSLGIKTPALCHRHSEGNGQHFMLA